MHNMHTPCIYTTLIHIPHAHTHSKKKGYKTMKRQEPQIETCAFEPGNTLSNANKRARQRLKIYALLDKVQENINEFKKLVKDKD